MEAALRFSQNSPPGSEDQRFLRIDVTGKAFWLCQVTSGNRKRIQYDIIHASSKVPAFRAFDWHPVHESLIAVGQSGGDATLLNIADGQQDSVSFSVRSQRLCNAVALSQQNLIAVGLDKVRTDFCLNVWDLNQRIAAGSASGFSKTQTEPLYKLAGGEPISSLKFFNHEPQLLLAGVKGQFVRLYDLREPNSSSNLQFQTRCVHNISIDYTDANYFGSCYPVSDPLVCLWDRRMISRTGATPVNFNGPVQSDSRQPAASLELHHVVDKPGTIWNMRFSKSQRGCFGVLSSVGQLKAYNFKEDYVVKSASDDREIQQQSLAWHESDPQDVYLDNVRDIEKPYAPNSTTKDLRKRIVSFDFTTGRTAFGEPQLAVLTGEGELRMVQLSPPPEPVGLSSTSFFCRGSDFVVGPRIDHSSESVPKCLDKVRRAAEPRNALRQAFKQSKQSKSSNFGHYSDLRRMSSFANQCWNADLGFFEKSVPLDDLLKLISAQRLRCEAGYLLNTSKNKTTVSDSQWLESYWNWLDRAEYISRNGNLTQENIDLAYIGVHGVWMEEIATKSRLVGSCSASKSTVIKNLVHRLNVPVRRLCPTEYRAHRQLCLYISGLGWSHEELENMVKKLTSGNQHTKAAALALFASDEKLAYQALRSKTSAQTHKMLAMALAGSKQQRKAVASAADTDDSSTEGEDDWTETITSLSADLTDPYARAILAYVKSGDWMDVLEIDALPLKHRVGIAIRHLDDNDLTAYIGRVTRQVIELGDIEGIVLTGTSTTEGLGLLSSYARIFNDLQSVILGLSVGGAAERFVANTNNRDAKAKRTIEAFRETYRSHIMRWGLKFDRVRFDVASSRALGQPAQQHQQHRPKEQIRLVCTFCSASLTQFPSNSNAGSTASTPSISQGPGSMRITDTHKHPLTSEKAAATGTVCPRCGRHLPRCGVCDLWLGTPDESYMKWYAQQQLQQQQQSNGTSNQNKPGSVDLAASMTGSVMTTIGPSTTSTSTATLKENSSRAVTGNHDEGDGDDAEEQDEFDVAREAEEKWQAVMQKFVVYCVTCGHGFHAGHARLWFEGRDGMEGHRVCPVPNCECRCNG